MARPIGFREKRPSAPSRDMLEYVTSRAAAWDCPVSMMANLKAFGSHPRTPANLEVLRRWEDVQGSKLADARTKKDAAGSGPGTYSGTQ
ncbi:MAG: hypothetical protein AB2L24_12595 [Mangrovibacterium sp.]